ncbi:hypothetical protein EPJ66_08030 [Brachyspira aalborgi]|uniref:Uncharacterized protein n=1 Tax=Brachyspira aalborgi TaxID=29522 RepID=A0A5C8FP88_9SPIR|nr:hypothetical protein [Brachyspira aalborgi]TXJ38931.1 hypothetical protein EPJ81_07355 [Brachyspira aalborgi]TXJ51432.1 hypothetical protein EPJ66_08030 [Brachyspira aalborgi]
MAIKIDIIPKYKDILKGFTENDNIIKNYYLKDNYGFALLCFALLCFALLNKITVFLFIFL